MRIVALEEHFALAGFGGRVAAPPRPELSADESLPAVVRAIEDKIMDLGAGRLADMDRAGISMQVLSKAGNHVTPSADMLDGQEAVAFARDFNDGAHRAIAQHPARLAAFAHLPMSVPEAAADELERSVKELGFHGALISGTVRGAFLDDRRFAPVLSR